MGTTISLTAADGHKFSAYLAEPQGTPRGAVVSAQEIFGVNGHMRRDADGIAAQGYRVIVPALFDRIERGVELGYGQPDVARGRDIRAKLQWDGVLADIEAARAHVKGAGKVGIVGYCYGGTVAFLAATRLTGFACAIGYYGGGTAGFAGEKSRCPLMFHFGEKDSGIPMSDVEKVRAGQPQAELHTYPTAGHGFNCDERASFDAAAAKLARERTFAFFKANIG